MAVAMVIVMTAACGSKEDMVELEEKKTDVSEEQAEEPETEESNAQEEEPVDDTAEMSEEERAVQEERETINRYSEEVLGIDPNEHKDAVELLGLPEDTMQQLYDMVEQSVRERYLTKYNISPQNFTWPENIGGKGEPKPWGYLGERLRQKAIQMLGGNDDSNTELETFYIDQQTAELMDCLFDDIVSWGESINLDPLMMGATNWNEIIIPNVIFE